MEEMDYTTNLVFWHIWSQHKTLKTKSIQKKFDSVGLDYIVAQNDSFPLNNRKFDETEQQNKLIKVAVTRNVEMVDLFKHGNLLINIVIKLDD